MGTDIWVHVEYQDRKKKMYKHAGIDIGHYRSYLLFDLLGGGRGNRNPLYHPRGLPGDVTTETYMEYKDGEPDFHHASWLDTQEYRECIDVFYEILRETIEAGSLSEDFKRDLEQIYQYMKDSDDEGEPARIVFWFDN